MKKFKIVSLLMVLAVMLCGGIISANAATSLPDKVVTDEPAPLTYFYNKGKEFRLVKKTTNNGKYYVYCLNMTATYAGGVEFTKTDVVDDGYLYILNYDLSQSAQKFDLPQFSKDEEFFIKQWAVWLYGDELAHNHANVEPAVLEYIVSCVSGSNGVKDPYAIIAYNLYLNAMNHKEFPGKLALQDSNVTFTLKDGYFVSSKIKVATSNLNEKTLAQLKWSMNNVPDDAKLETAGDDGIIIKIPEKYVPEGKQLTFSITVSGSYKKSTGYYYYNSPKYQKLLFQNPLETTIPVSATLTLVVKHFNEHFDINISKTDVTQSKEVAGATLEVKDAKGNLIESWVSTDKTHKITLTAGEYSLTETIAPKGYKLSKTTIYFMIDNNGGVFVKDENGKYVSVNRVVMINELIDVISVAKKDSRTGEYVSGAKLVIKDEKGNVVKEFMTSDTVYQLSLEEGKYTLSEVSAPAGYLLSSEVVHFEVLSDGTLKIMNNNGEYVDSALITFYNEPATSSKIDVSVPATGKNATLLVIGGIALLIGGIACAKKTIKEC